MAAACGDGLAHGGSGPLAESGFSCCSFCRASVGFDKTRNLYTIRAQDCRCQSVKKKSCSHHFDTKI
jgi:hypothetical protein